MAVSDAEFGKLLEEIAPQLESYVLQTTGSRELAEELTHGHDRQGVACQTPLVGFNPFAPGSFAFCTTTGSDQSRKWERQNVVATDQIDEIAVDPIKATPGDLASMREEIRAVWSKLSLEHRQVIQLVVINEQDPAEVAAMLGVAEGTVTSRLTRARRMAKRIRAELEA